MRISSSPYLLSPGVLHYNTAVPTSLCSLVKLSSSFHMGYFKHTKFSHQGFPGGSDAKESSCNERDPDSIPGLGRSPGEGNVYPLQCSCLENSLDRGAWKAAVHQIQDPDVLSDSHIHLHPQCSRLLNPICSHSSINEILSLTSRNLLMVCFLP